VEETKCLTVENTRKVYNLVYISCGVFGLGSDRKEIVDLMTAIIP
jgi:hypothetical protein